MPVVLVFVAALLAQQAPAPAAQPASMQGHFRRVILVHEAIVRGDLAGAKEAATAMAAQDEPGIAAPTAAPFMAAIRTAAGTVAAASDIAAAATGVATMLATCGECHRATGTMPAATTRTRPPVGGRVGHMLEHQRAIDLMVQGLVVPSNSLWRTGARVLETAPLKSGDLPKDPGLTRKVVDAEDRVHGIAARAAQAENTADRAAAYGRLAATCAECHGLHGKQWGPTSK